MTGFPRRRPMTSTFIALEQRLDVPIPASRISV